MTAICIKKRTGSGCIAVAWCLLAVCLSCTHTIPTITVSPSSIGGISAALQNAAEGCTVQVEAGYYSGALNRNLLLNRTLNLVGTEGPAKTVIDCEHQSRCLVIMGSSTFVNVSGITFRNGFEAGANQIDSSFLPSQDFGGCVLVTSHASVFFSDFRLFGCISSQGGGIGVYMASMITIQNSLISFSGINSTTSRSASLIRGGGAYFVDTCTVLLRNTTISFNYLFTEFPSVGGGGVSVMQQQAVTSLRVIDCTFSNNAIASTIVTLSTYLTGGGMYLKNISNVVIYRSIFSNNSISSWGSIGTYGGGMHFNQGTGVAVLSDLVFQANSILNLMPGDDSAQISGAGFTVGSRVDAVLSNITTESNFISGFNTMNGAGFYIPFSIVTFLGRLSAFSNTLTQLGDFTATGSAFCFTSTHQVTFKVELFQLVGNSITATGNRNLYGALYAESIDIITINSEIIVVSNNSVTSSGSGIVLGAGISIINCFNVSIEAGKFFAAIGNRIIVSVPTTISKITETYSFPLETADRAHCNSSTPVISALNGEISDGSVGDYSGDLDCMWVINGKGGNRFAKYFGRFNVSFDRFDLEESAACTGDSVALYNGIGTTSALIGIYCGNGICSKGQCPSLSAFFTTTASLTVHFQTDSSTAGNGFRFKWNLIQFEGYHAGATGVIPEVIQTGSLGAAIAISGSNLKIGGDGAQNSQDKLYAFFDNFASHPIFASGAALVATIKSRIEISSSNLIFWNNTAMASVAAGGALSCIENSKIETKWGDSSSMQLNFTDNKAIAVGNCYYSNDGVVRCPASFGGAFVSAIGGSTILTGKSIFLGNMVGCRGPECTAQGGGLSVSHSSSMLQMAFSTCSQNTVICQVSSTEIGRCKFGSGGCLHVADGFAAITKSSRIEFNSVFGTGGGGGVSASGSATIVLNSFVVNQNAAPEGGAIWGAGTSICLIFGGTIANNSAFSIAGGIAITQDSSFDMRDIILAFNSAKSRASSMLLFSDNNGGHCNMTNVTILQAEPSNAAIMLGHVTSPVTVFNCTWPGSIVQEDYTVGEFYSVSCLACGPGTYAVASGSTEFDPKRECLPCPPGAICKGSYDTNSTGLMALAGYWGVADRNGTATFYQCPPGYCCPQLQSGLCPFDYCYGNRMGVLCGQCPEGYGLAFFTEACVPTLKCIQSSWVFPLASVGSVLFVLFLYRTAQNETTGISSVFLFFYQVLNLVKSSPWSTPAFSRATFLFEAIANMSPGSSDTSSTFEGMICLFPSMSAARKLGTRILFQGWVAAMLAMMYCCHLLYSNIGKKYRIVDVPLPNKKQYLATAVRLLTIVYISLLLVPLQMIQCIYIQGQHVWMWDASISCYKDWQIGCMVVIGSVGMIPFLVMYVMWRKWRNIDGLSDTSKLIREILRGGFRHGKRWYLGIALYRRLALALASSLILDKNWRSVSISILLLVSLVGHLVMKPYSKDITNQAETACLTILVMLSILSSIQSAQVQFGSSSTIQSATSLEGLEAFFMLVPLLLFPTSIVLLRKQEQNLKCQNNENLVTVDFASDNTGISLQENHGSMEMSNEIQYC